MNANNRFMNYTIANIRVSLPDACTGEHFTRALRPFLTLGAGPADLALEIVPRIPAEADYRELDIFEFPDADADCRFGTDAAGYLLEMTPRDGSAPARYRMAYGAAAARSDITPGHNPALFRFGVWILFNIAALPLGAVAFHSSVIRYRGRGVLFLGESGTGKSTHTRLWREHIPGAELLNDDSPIIRATDSEALVHGSPWSGKTPCYRNESCPIAAVVRLSQAPHNRIRRLRQHNPRQNFSGLRGCDGKAALLTVKKPQPLRHIANAHAAALRPGGLCCWAACSCWRCCSVCTRPCT